MSSTSPKPQLKALCNEFLENRAAYSIVDGHIFQTCTPEYFSVCFCGVYKDGEVVLCSDILNEN